MTARQHARDQFERIMRAPDLIVNATFVISFAVPFAMLPTALLGSVRDSEIWLFLAVMAGSAAVYAIYFMVRFLAALGVAAVAVARARRVTPLN